MPTSDERREVAARLREDASCSESSPRVAVESYLGVEYDGADAFEESYKSESLLRLADLIDPTCEMVPATRHPYGDYANCRCSACGYDGAFEPLVRPVDGYPVPDERMWRYCPHCGARVANNGE